MKKIFLILTAFCFLFTNESSAQNKKKAKQTSATVEQTDGLATPKTIDDATKGVMGEDTIKNNKKGLRRNLNSNTGVDLPPNDGVNTNK